jgi:hypothetical protein
MLIQRLQPPLRATLASIVRSGSSNPQAALNEAFASLRLCAAPVTGVNGATSVRHAAHKAQGAVNKAKDGPGKRLGAKKSGGVFVPFRYASRRRLSLSLSAFLLQPAVRSSCPGICLANFIHIS